MEEHIQDIMRQKKLYAYINFFKLLIIGQVSMKDVNNFCLVDGMEKLTCLMDDINQKILSLFSDNGEAKYISTLFYEMTNLCQELQSNKVSKSTILENAFDDVTRITSYYNRNFVEDDTVADLTLLTFLPIEVAEMIDVRQVILAPLSKQKKLGER